jgi:hypothetical protein
MPVLEKIELIRQCAAVSSGTMGTITGYRRYDDIDRITEQFIEYVRATEKEFTCWQKAWESFVSEKNPVLALEVA